MAEAAPRLAREQVCVTLGLTLVLDLAPEQVAQLGPAALARLKERMAELLEARLRAELGQMPEVERVLTLRRP